MQPRDRPNPITYRDAASADAPALGALHVASWREAYPGLLPKTVLDALRPEDRAAQWAAALAVGDAEVVLALSGPSLVGFAAGGAQRDPSLRGRGYDGEVGALYVLRSYQRAGAGAELMTLLARRLRGRGHRGAALWVLRDNAPARAFYERLGGALVGERPGEAAEVAYGWPDLARLT